MKFSIITVTKNNKEGMFRAIECVRSQSYQNVEHIIVDGSSEDGSIEILKQVQDQAQNDILRQAQGDIQPNNPYSLSYISEADSGIYDAINKGITLATGDVIGLLHSDDFYADENVLAAYAEAFQQQTTNDKRQTIEAVYSDLVYVKSGKREERSIKKDSSRVKEFEIVRIEKEQQTTHYSLLTTCSVIRYWKTQNKEFTTESQRHRALKNGWMPPHPTLFIRKEIFDKYGLYRTDMKIAADYEMILRLLYQNKIITHYLPLTTYCMTIGGASNKSLKNIFIKSTEDYSAMKIHSLPFPIKTLMLKNLVKIPQYFKSKE